LQAKLKEANESLSSKVEAVRELEGQIQIVKSSLEAVQSDVQSKQATIEQFEQTRRISEAELAEMKATLQKLKDEDARALLSVQRELDTAREAAAEQTKVVQNLQTQVQILDTELATNKENLDAIQAAHSSASSDAAAAAKADHAALVNAMADLKSITAEKEGLKAAHIKAFEDVTAKLNEYQSKAAGVETLEKELIELRAEKEETANKLSELEVEILELKESQEKAQDEHSEALSKIKSLEEELAKAAAATQRAISDAAVKDGEHLQCAVDVKNKHNEELKAMAEEQAKIVAQIKILEDQLAGNQAAHEQTKADAQAASETYNEQLNEAQRLYLVKRGELTEQIQKISAELEAQEAQYNAKVDAVKVEHNKLLDDAFERAKNEAGEAHSRDLQSLRAESQATIEQLRTAHESSIEDMKNEHASILDSHVNALQKQINSQTLELKATHEDLVKAKATLEASRVEVASLAVQLEEAKAAASAEIPPDPAVTEEIERLNRELSHAKDDVAATHDALDLTKQSLSDILTNKTKELEEAAKGRAEDVIRLKVAHEEEIAALVGQKSELAIKLSDLEGELATLRASASVEIPTSPKTNGTNGTAQPVSPGVTKEELQSMHEAHNAKVHDLQAEHDKALRALKESLDASLSRSEELQEEVARKEMEIRLLEQEREDNVDQITRLKEDMESLPEQLQAKEVATPA